MLVDHIGSYLSKDEREELYHKAESLYNDGEVKEAVVMFLKCLQNLNAASSFNSLPKCLRALSSHFFDEQDYNKAVHFLQAERLFYESALLDTSAFMKKVDECKAKSIIEYPRCSYSSRDEDALRPRRDKVMEFENLTRYFQDNHLPDEDINDQKEDDTLLDPNNNSLKNMSLEMKSFEEYLDMDQDEYFKNIDNSNVKLGEHGKTALSQGDELYDEGSTFKVPQFNAQVTLDKSTELFPKHCHNDKNLYDYLSQFKFSHVVFSVIFITICLILMLNFNKLASNKCHIIQGPESIEKGVPEVDHVQSKVQHTPTKMPLEIYENESITNKLIDNYDSQTIKNTDNFNHKTDVDKEIEIESNEKPSSNEVVQPMDAVLNPIIDTYKQLKHLYYLMMFKKTVIQEKLEKTIHKKK